jgi:hypothetical protein
VSLAALTLLCLGAAGPALAAGATAPPTVDQIVGQYAVACKYMDIEYGQGKTYKGSYKSVFTITKVSDTVVDLVWRNDVGEEWFYQASYRNGVLTMGIGDETSPVAEWIEVMVLAFSGTPGKIGLSGKYPWHRWFEQFVDIETLKGKAITP